MYYPDDNSGTDLEYLEYLIMGTHWRPTGKDVMHISEMETNHIENLLAYFKKDYVCKRYHQLYAWKHRNSFDWELFENHFSYSPEEWMSKQLLVKNLEKLLKSRTEKPYIAVQAFATKYYVTGDEIILSAEEVRICNYNPATKQTLIRHLNVQDLWERYNRLRTRYADPGFPSPLDRS